jgi:thiosulfate/3-mercaptopyruvate sulfurtransferase
MTYTTLISTVDLANALVESNCRIIDCRFDLADTTWGRKEYLESHIPGALYAHLDEDLSGPVSPGCTGRHPLPEMGSFVQCLSAWGIDRDTQVIAYDQGPGMFAARLWWMLRRLGHEKIAVLEGGWQKWQQEGLQVDDVVANAQPRTFVPAPREELEASVDDVVAAQGETGVRLLDARPADRFRGENETIDPVAGHIPGAISAPFMDNLGTDGCLLEKAALRERYLGLLGNCNPQNAIIYCGSGVTAAHDVLAMVHAGLDEPRLYVGSWSHWITDPSRPVGT